MPQRTLSESEFNTIKAKVLDSLPAGLSEDEFNRIVPSKMAQALGEAESLPAAPEGSAVGRFVSNAAEVLNPLTIAEGAYNAVRHPIDTATNLIGAQVNQGRQAIDLAKQGRGWEASGHAIAAVTPIVGPIAAQAGEQIAAGDVAGGLGKGLALEAPFAAQKLLEARGAAQGATRAPILEREAAQQVAGKVLAPGNPAYRGRAAAIAPEVLARKLTGGRAELAQAAEEGMADAGAKLDDAIQAAGGVKAPIPAADVVARLQSRIAELQDSSGKPLSGQAAVRIKALQGRIYQVKGLAGKAGTVTFEDLRKIRDENYRIADEARGYEKRGNDTMKDEGWAARETGSSIRQVFADRSPASAAANADYSFWKTLNDVLDPAIGRPKAQTAPSGVTGGAQTAGAVAGHVIGGKGAAFVLSVVVPWFKNRIADSSWQLADAQSKMKLAQALKTGNQGMARTMMLKIQQYGPKATSPSESQAAPAPATQP